MSTNKFCLLIISLAAFFSVNRTAAQNEHSNPITSIEYSQHDSIPVSVTEADMDRISDMRMLLRQGNATYSKPMPLTHHLLELMGQYVTEEISYLSEEALAVLEQPTQTNVFPDYLTFKDTMIMRPIFLPIIFKAENLAAKLDPADTKVPRDYKYKLYEPDYPTIFKKQTDQKEAEDELMSYIETYHPSLIKYSDRDVPKNKVVLIPINTPVYEEVPIQVIPKAKVEDTEAPAKFIPDRLYWTSAFESSIQFSQSKLSPNWFQGGSDNLNIVSRNYLKYNYNKEPVLLTNELEIKTTLFNAPNDTLRSYKLGDDVFRLHSNLGIRAFLKWYYSLDAEFRTPLFTNYQENKSVKQAALLSPFSLNVAPGMKYDMTKTFKERGRRLALSLNISPLSLYYLRSLSEDIDLGRHGFKKKPETEQFETELQKLGTTINVNIDMSFNRNVRWTSRILYFSNYESVKLEFENTLTLAISRFFSTTIYFYPRYDDAVTKKPDYDTFLQFNERLTFGFNYRW